MSNRGHCYSPRKSCFNDTYDDYEESNRNKQGFNICSHSFKENLCNRIKRVQETSKILEHVLDIATTLTKILCSCGIPECKANRAIDVIIYTFMHFDEVVEHPGAKCKKRIRKEEFYNDLRRDCGMTKAEAKLTYSIVKSAFKAFYHKQIINRYDSEYIDECEWRNAANRTINAFAQSGATRSETQLTARRILCTYQNYLNRLQVKKSAKQSDDRNCMHMNFGIGGVGGGPTTHDTSYIPNYNYGAAPPLCGQFNCHMIDTSGCNGTQVICTDQCGRIFLKVDGSKINFDPFILECEAKRAAGNYTCCTVGTNTCDENQEIGKDKGDDKDPNNGMHNAKKDNVNAEDEKNKNDDNKNKDDISSKKDDSEKTKDNNNKEEEKKKEDTLNDDKHKHPNQIDKTEDSSSKADKAEDENEKQTLENQKILPSDKLDSLIIKQAKLDSEMAISIKLGEQKDGYVMEVDMLGYCFNNGHLPKNITTLKVKTNQNSPIEFSCTPK